MNPVTVSARNPIVVRRWDAVPDPAAAYDALFAGRLGAFWLDGEYSAVLDGDPVSTLAADDRPGWGCSILGAADGPLGEFLSYDVETGTLAVRTAQTTRICRVADIFSYLNEQIAARHITAPCGIPGDIAPGYVGYLGYELKALTGGRAVHRSPFPDAALTFADRLLLLDHHGGATYALALAGSASETWFARVERALADAPARHVRGPRNPSRFGPASVPTRQDAVGWAAALAVTEEVSSPYPVTPRHDTAAYRARIEECRRDIAAGDAYELCLTTMLTTPRVDPRRLFHTIRAVTPAPYAALLEFPDAAVVCASPELFCAVDAAGWVTSGPIKGTRRRSADPLVDAELRRDLATCAKDRAENVMIVDLLRNDLGRVCRSGTIDVSRLCAVETYPTVHQLVSTIRGRLNPNASAIDAVRAAFPPGSMTGAPKIRSMEILDAREGGPRGVYSGALGWFSLTGTARLAVVIRTAVIDADAVHIGTGGAVTIDSDPDAEIAETAAKAAGMLHAIRLSRRPAAPYGSV